MFWEVKVGWEGRDGREGNVSAFHCWFTEGGVCAPPCYQFSYDLGRGSGFIIPPWRRGHLIDRQVDEIYKEQVEYGCQLLILSQLTSYVSHFIPLSKISNSLSKGCPRVQIHNLFCSQFLLVRGVAPFYVAAEAFKKASDASSRPVYPRGRARVPASWPHPGPVPCDCLRSELKDRRSLSLSSCQ